MPINQFISSQLEAWPQAAENYAALQSVKVKEITLPGGFKVKVQFNPGRAVSSGAKVDAASIKKRPCFLCEKNRPEVQFGLDRGQYVILINPFPIFPRHLTIPDVDHVPQLIAGRAGDMYDIARELTGFTVFYNGPRCGASAPDHCHFQAGNSDFLPITEALADFNPEPDTLMVPDQVPWGVIVFDATSRAQAKRLFDRVYRNLPMAEGGEPMMNVLCYAIDDARTRFVIIPRKAHRPSFYGTEGEDVMMISPASVDMGGAFITPREIDFERIGADEIMKIVDELCLTPAQARKIASRRIEEPQVSVGIMSDKLIEMNLHGNYMLDGDKFSGSVVLKAAQLKEEMMFVPTSRDCYAEVKGVTIGVNFHWERRENQRFAGAILVMPHDDELVLINILPVEDYLTSVISSEMSATSSLELLKAHAVISRSWLLAQIEKSKQEDAAAAERDMMVRTDSEVIVWYDREDHTLFDVCADDHCQRYQGITRASTEAVRDAIAATRGQVLTYDGELCDARFSKCCGGVFEQFENCWEPEFKPYLEAAADTDTPDVFPDLTIEENARQWILSSPPSFCNTTDRETLSQVLNNYDRETPDFFRWRVDYTQEEISDIVRRRTGDDFGTILAIVPLERGTSGRITRLRIVGTRKTREIGKELEIRRTLSESHLYSSAFVVEKTPGGFALHGAGWGHGVGLCQIGAAMMASQGHDYRQILNHYFIGADITPDYNH